MTAERAIKILESYRQEIPLMPTYEARMKIAEKKLERAEKMLHESQKLTATYGTERVKGGKMSNPIELSLIKAQMARYEAEKDYNDNEEKLDNAKKLREKAKKIVFSMPKKTWILGNRYYLKYWTVKRICRYKHWSSRNSWYKWLANYHAIITEQLKEE